MADPAPGFVDTLLGRMGAQRERLRGAIGARAAEGVEFVIFAALAMPWIAAGLRPDDAPWFGLTIAPLMVIGWILLALRGGDSEAAAKGRNRGLLALCLAACVAGGLACVIAFTPKKGSGEEWLPPPSTLETQYGAEPIAPK